MPPIFIPRLPCEGVSQSSSSMARLSPSQRVVRVLQVTRANWHVLPGGRRKWRSQPDGAPRA